MLSIYIRRRASTYKCYDQKSWSQLSQTLLYPQQDIFKVFCLFVHHFLSFFSGSGSFHGVSYQTNNHYFGLKKSNEMKQYGDIYLLLNYSVCFERPSRPSSGLHKTLVADSGTDHTIWGASFFKRDQIRTVLGRTACSVKYTSHCMIYMICTRGCNYSLCTPDDGRDGRPKHVE